MNIFDFRTKLKRLQAESALDKELWKERPNTPLYIKAATYEDAFGYALYLLDDAPQRGEPWVEQIRYNPHAERMVFNCDSLHCGTVLEVLLPDEGWVCDRLEFDDSRKIECGCYGWYLVNHPRIQVDGLWARI